MPNYKRKKVPRNYAGKSKAVKETAAHYEKIDMVSDDEPVKKTASPIRVLKGKRLERLRKFRVSISVVSILLILIGILHFALPCGIMENVYNFTARIGTGEYPNEIFGTSVIDSVSKNGYYYVLSDTDLSCFTNGGKKVYYYSHGFEKPVITTSPTRAIIYEQGGDEVYVYNLKGQVCSLKTDDTIISASLSRNGNFAVATHSNSYSSVLNVYNKKGKVIYTWNSSKYIIKDVVLSSSGKKAVISLVTAKSGSFDSCVYVLNFNSADPEYTMSLDDNIVYSITESGRGFTVYHQNGYVFVSWSKYRNTKRDFDRSIYMVRHTSYGDLLVCNLDSNHKDNKIFLLGNIGQNVSEFEFDGVISDIQYNSGHIYLLSESTVYLFDKKGNNLGNTKCDYSARKIAPIGSHSVALLTYNSVLKLQIKN